MNHLPREVAFGKLQAMADAGTALRGGRVSTPS
jgi:hypothetical protein